MDDLIQDVVLKATGSDAATKRKLDRRDKFRTTDIALPQVLWIDEGQDARLLDAESDLFPAIDWAACDMEAMADTLPKHAHAAASQLVRIRTGKESGFVTEAATTNELDLAFDAPHAVRMLSDIVPNPYVARVLVGRVVDQLNARDFDADMIGRMTTFIVDEMRKHLGAYRDGQAAKIFGERLDTSQIEFRVRGDEGDWIAPDHIWTSAAEGAPQINNKTGGALERSLFLPVYASELNSDETKVAVYLDAEAVIKWWHRNGTERGSYALRGWRRGNVYPDFVFASLRDDNGERIVALESKGDHLDNLDTAYKRQLLDQLTKAYGKKAATKSGELGLEGKAVDYQAAVVLFKDMDRDLPRLIVENDG